MKLAILFWFYKDVALCINRLQLLRRYNPNLRIYGLYGGDPAEAPAFQAALTPHLDAFYAFDEDHPPHWKWINGDIVIARWYEAQGRHLEWDTVAVVQWDMVVLTSLRDAFSDLKKDEMLLSGLRPVDEVIEWWYWLRRQPENLRSHYERFVAHLREAHSYHETPFCCQFIVACLPRRLLEAYGNLVQPDLGFIEYRLPTYAHLMGIPLRQKPRYDQCWIYDPAQPTDPIRYGVLNGGVKEVRFRTILRNYFHREGLRLFHPVSRTVPLDLKSTVTFLRETAGLYARSAWSRLQKIYTRPSDPE